jgi:uncharacterized protein (TIGR03437 family)
VRRHTTLAVLAVALPLALLADINSNATLSSGTSFSFDTGTQSASGDILFTGTGISFTNGAKGGVLPVGTGSQAFGLVNQAILQSFAATPIFSTSPVAAGSLTSNAIVGVQTKGGNYAKFLVTSVTSATLAFQFTTYGVAGGGGGAPTITSILNNSSTIPNGFSNSGVAPSTLIVIKGTGMADPAAQAVLQDSSQGLPSTLNGASVSVSAGGKTYPLGIYYAIATQIAAVLPAAVPVGPATLTVSYNGTPSSAASFNVVPSAFGISNYSGNTAVVQDPVLAAAGDPNLGLLIPTRSGKPGEVVVIWGTGLGGDPSDSDTTYTTTPHAINTPLQIFIGGVPVTNIAYAGASVYPGVHVIGLTIPQGVPNGCFVPIIILTGNSVVSNSPTIPIMASGGVCSDTDINAVGGQNTQNPLRTASLIVGQLASGGSTSSFAQASFDSITNLSSVGGGGGGGQASVGTCTFTQLNGNGGGGSATFTGLDAGTINLTGPVGSYALLPVPSQKGSYYASLPAGAIPASGGTFTFNNGSGGVDVGGFTATVTFPTPVITWTNQSAAATVTRSSGLLVTWNGGQPGSTVFISGGSSNNGAVGGFFCYAPQSALQFTVPSYILGTMPAGAGSVTVEDETAYGTFTAPRLDYGYTIGVMGISVTSTYR